MFKTTIVYADRNWTYEVDWFDRVWMFFTRKILWWKTSSITLDLGPSDLVMATGAGINLSMQTLGKRTLANILDTMGITYPVYVDVYPDVEHFVEADTKVYFAKKLKIWFDRKSDALLFKMSL